ncbi:hypothetical protein [Saccharibacillus alkalitolerans]|uniref:GNAT family N-acetyltransferase n=1 Tax=Saccharibacillus alkalitolerans TaxID=2705290 RepID=A0ABX0F9D8_9BACL|nr:hypothetical protein [Saccharibacillus alkalitolerans]NGZ76933.1 hypothetical protein [Saccharibacillus alkalitolerans]
MITIRFAEQGDIPRIQAVARDAWTSAYRGIYPETIEGQPKIQVKMEREISAADEG